MRPFYCKLADMARLPRLYAPHLPHLAQASFALPLTAPDTAPIETLNRLGGWLAEEARMHGVAIHGWTLTFDQLLLLATPAGPSGMSGLLQALGRRLAAYRRAGRVFAGRYRSTLVEPGAWVLPSLAWMETLPMREGLVADLEQWQWSSACAHVGAAANGFVTDHADYWAYGNTPFDRQARYRRYLLAGLGQTESLAIERALKGQWALGSAAFVAELGNGAASRRPVAAQRGRPRKTTQPRVAPKID